MMNLDALGRLSDSLKILISRVSRNWSRSQGRVGFLTFPIWTGLAAGVARFSNGGNPQSGNLTEIYCGLAGACC